MIFYAVESMTSSWTIDHFATIFSKTNILMRSNLNKFKEHTVWTPHTFTTLNSFFVLSASTFKILAAHCLFTISWRLRPIQNLIFFSVSQSSFFKILKLLVQKNRKLLHIKIIFVFFIAKLFSLQFYFSICKLLYKHLKRFLYFFLLSII